MLPTPPTTTAASTDNPIMTLAPVTSPEVAPAEATAPAPSAYQLLLVEQANILKESTFDPSKLMAVMHKLFALIITESKTTHAAELQPFVEEFAKKESLEEMLACAQSAISSLVHTATIPLFGYSIPYMNNRGKFSSMCQSDIIVGLNAGIKQVQALKDAASAQAAAESAALAAIPQPTDAETIEDLKNKLVVAQEALKQEKITSKASDLENRSLKTQLEEVQRHLQERNATIRRNNTYIAELENPERPIAVLFSKIADMFDESPTQAQAPPRTHIKQTLEQKLATLQETNNALRAQLASTRHQLGNALEKVSERDATTQQTSTTQAGASRRRYV